MPLIEFTTTAALIGLVLLLPIILLYLLKPKPKHVRFPSVMFILDTEKKRKFRTFLKKIFRDPLLILQLMIIAALVFATAGPYLFSVEDENSKETAVIIIDSSASMQANDLEPSRFSKAVGVAKDIIQNVNEESRINIVLAENSPVVLTKNQSKKNAALLLTKSFVSDTPSNIADTILFSKDLFMAGEQNKKVYVISDFAQVDSSDLVLSQRILAQNNITVKYVKVKGSGANMGIIDAKAKRFVTDRGKFYLTYTIKNYFDSEKDIEAEIVLDNKVIATQKKSILPHSEKLLNFEGVINNSEHRIEVRLKNEDVLSADNTANLFLPRVKRYAVLLITDEGKDQYLKYALESSKDIELRTAIPPVIPTFDPFDVVIFGDLKNEFLLPGTFKDLKSHVESGSHAIFLPSDGLAATKSYDLNAILPVTMGVLREKRSSIEIFQDNEIFNDIVPRGALVFPDVVVEKFMEAGTINPNYTLATISESSNKSPAIAYMPLGAGKILYVGINPSPKWSNMYYSSTFPVFWMQIIDWLTREESTLGVNNFRTGDYLPLTEAASVTMPSGKTIQSGNMVIDEAGFYQIDRGVSTEWIAASLLNDKESDISKDTTVDSLTDENLKIRKTQADVKRNLLHYVIIAALFLVLFEIYYYRRRGVI